MSNILELKKLIEMNPMDLLGKEECVGCNETENLEKCGGKMCRSCWERENE